ncbi:unnamed protein product [Periconia digitata]|uniref:ubiquitinyl hydrolase 1 n=1 Tax=Periconia digitata TaxID=1303443 RepID=A0A9W4U7Z4_9PLEO|nr:unnamed protein product [Periconia digitata]
MVNLLDPAYPLTRRAARARQHPIGPNMFVLTRHLNIPQAANTNITQGTTTVFQAYKDNVAGTFRKSWPIRRRWKRSMRIANNTGVACYQNSAIQSLMHLPKFVNWILTHNQQDNGGNIDWPCDRSGELRTCVACVLKNLALVYWMNRNLRPTHVLTHEPELRAFRTLAHRINNEREGSSTRPPRQQDADEFLRHVFTHLEHSTQANIVTRINDEFEALFQLYTLFLRVCDDCKTSRPGSQHYLSVGLDTMNRFPDNREDSVQGVIDRHFAGDEPYTTTDPACSCGSSRVQRPYEIVSAPLYLRVVLPAHVPLDPTRRHKRHDHFPLDKTIDLTHWQQDPSTPLRYRLRGAMRHIGDSVNTGHYIADVTGPEGKIYRTNDAWDVLSNLPVGRRMIDNPVPATNLDSNDDDADAYTLFYERIKN